MRLTSTFTCGGPAARVLPYILYRTLSLLTGIALLPECGIAQVPGPVMMTPHHELGLRSGHVAVPERFSGAFDPARTVRLPEGYRAQIFWIGGIRAARFMTWGPDSVLYVASFGDGKVYALPDRNRDDIADTAILAAQEVWGHDVEFYDGDMYVAAETRVMKLRDTDGDGFYETRSVFIDGLGSTSQTPTGGHITRTIVFDSVNGSVYVSIGSSCNVCRENGRADIEQFNIDGTGRRVHATGIRNAVGMTLHPRTGRLWATNNGSDLQGNDIPPEWIDLVRRNGFYGWPFAYAPGAYFDFTVAEYSDLLPITPADSASVRSMVQPAALVQAHTAPMAIEFADASFPEPYRRGAFVALHGSWNRFPSVGASVIYLDFEDDADTVANYVADFMSGFMVDSISGDKFARPVGLETDHRGRLYVSSDQGDQIFVVIPTGPVGAAPSVPGEPEIGLRSTGPNPLRESTSIEYALAGSGHVRLMLVDAMGRAVRTLVDRSEDAGARSALLDVTDLLDGLYFCRLESPSGTDVRPIVVMK